MEGQKTSNSGQLHSTSDPELMRNLNILKTAILKFLWSVGRMIGIDSSSSRGYSIELSNTLWNLKIIFPSALMEICLRVPQNLHEDKENMWCGIIRRSISGLYIFELPQLNSRCMKTCSVTIA